MAEFEVIFERDEDWRSFQGTPYLFEPEYTDEELAQIEEEQRAAEAASAEIAEATDTPSRCEGDWWCSCGGCRLMATEEECLCCRESDIFRSLLDNSDARCLTATDNFPSLINPGVVKVFFHVPKVNWKKKPTPDGPDGQLSAK